MAFSSTDVEALETAIASGTLSVALNGREIRYRDMDDLIKAYNLIKRQVESGTKPSLRRGRYNSGYSD